MNELLLEISFPDEKCGSLRSIRIPFQQNSIAIDLCESSAFFHSYVYSSIKLLTYLLDLLFYPVTLSVNLVTDCALKWLSFNNMLVVPLLLLEHCDMEGLETW